MSVPDADRLAEIQAIRETLFTGGYDGTEGQESSNDTTWTDFGIVVGIAERQADALRVSREREARLADALKEARPYVVWLSDIGGVASYDRRTAKETADRIDAVLADTDATSPIDDEVRFVAEAMGVDKPIILPNQADATTEATDA